MLNVKSTSHTPLFKLSSLCIAIISSAMLTGNVYASDEIQTLDQTVMTTENDNVLNKNARDISKSDIDLGDLGRSVTVIDGDVLIERGAEDIRKAFDYVAGFNTSGAGHQSFMARGVSNLNSG